MSDRPIALYGHLRGVAIEDDGFTVARSRLARSTYTDASVNLATVLPQNHWPWSQHDRVFAIMRAEDFDRMNAKPPGTRTVTVCDLHDDCKSDLRIAEACWLERAHKGGA